MTFTVGQQVTSAEAASLPDGSLYTWTLTEQYEIRDGRASYLGRQQNPTTRTVTFLPPDPEPPVRSSWVDNDGHVWVHSDNPLAFGWTRVTGIWERATWADLNERGGTLIYRAEETT